MARRGRRCWRREVCSKVGNRGRFRKRDVMKLVNSRNCMSNYKKYQNQTIVAGMGLRHRSTTSPNHNPISPKKPTNPK
jgi:hypothetical protein